MKIKIELDHEDIAKLEQGKTIVHESLINGEEATIEIVQN